MHPWLLGTCGDRRRGYGLLAAVVLVFGAGACGVDARESDIGARTARAVQPVIGGVPSGPERDAVLLMLAQGTDRSSQCTATLVAPNLVVTVRHCISVYVEGTFTCTIEGNLDLNRARNPVNAGEMGFVYPPEVISFHTGQTPDFDAPATVGKQVFALQTDTICRNDIAFVLLEDSLDLPIAPVRLGSGTFPGESTLIVGYGINESRTSTRHERSDVDILHVGPSEFFSIEGSALPRTFVVGPSACSGDSGGPALSQETGAVLGASSLSRGDCESSEVRNFYTQLAPYEELALEAFAAAGHEPLLEATEGEEPAPGAGGASPGSAGSPASDVSDPGDAGSGCAYSPRGGRPPLIVWAGILGAWALARRSWKRSPGVIGAGTADSER